MSTSVYEGPLDLLLELIETAELDITTLALAQVTSQYLEYIKILENQHPGEVSAFLVIASKLLQIKSSALLPKSPLADLGEKEDDPGEDLVRQLILYKMFKDIASILEEREIMGYRTFLRVAAPKIHIEPKLDLSNIDINKIHMAAVEIFLQNRHLKPLNKVVNIPRITIGDKIKSIIKSLKDSKITSFSRILLTKSRQEVVVTFLAMLELIKRNIILAHQEALFQDIELSSNEEEMTDEVTDIEFVE